MSSAVPGLVGELLPPGNQRGEDSTQIHTHLCYSEFNEIIDSINALNADVTSIEAARSHMELLADIPESFVSGLGPGVWDIHSPRCSFAG